MESIGVASGCGCKEVYRFPHITYPYSSCICSFFAVLFVLFFKCFSFFIIYHRTHLLSAYAYRWSWQKFMCLITSVRLITTSPYILVPFRFTRPMHQRERER